MSNSKAQLARSLPQLLREMEVKDRKLAGEDRITFTGINSTSTAVGGSGKRDSEPNVTPLASFLRTEGDTMVGALAFYPTIVNISSGAIDISKETSGKFSTYVQVNGEGSTDDTLTTITGAAFAGQIIYLQPNTVTKLTVTETGGNIQLPGGTDIVVNAAKDGASILKFIFDPSIAGPAPGNVWVLVSNSEGGGGTGVTFPVDPVIKDFGTTSGTLACKLDASDTGDGHSFKVTANGNVTLTFDNPPASGTQHEFEVEFVQDGTGGRTLSLPASVIDTVTVDSAINTTTILTFRTNDGGTTYFALAIRKGAVSGGPFLPLTGGTMTGDITMDGNDIDMVSGTIKNFVGWTNAVGQSFVSDANGGTWGTPTGDAYLFNIAGLAQLTVNETGVNVHANDIILDADADSKFVNNVDDVLTLNLGGVAEYIWTSSEFTVADVDILFTEIITPVNPAANNLKLYAKDVGGITELFVKDSAGTETSLFSGGANKALDNLTSVQINADLEVDTDSTYDLGKFDKRFKILNIDEIDIQDDTANNPAGGRSQITADSGGIMFGVSAVSDDFNFFFGGATDFLIKEDGELQMNTPGRQHKIVPTSTSFDIVAENQADEVELWSGSARTNASVFVGDQESVFTTENDVVTKYDITIQQRHTTPADGRVIGDISWEAENSSSALTEYATIEGESSVVTAGAEQGRLRFGVQVNSVTGVVGIELIGVSTALRMGFFGTTPVIQQSVASDTLANLYTALRNYGWIV